MRYQPDSDMQVLQDLVRTYDEPAEKRDPETAFLMLADAFRIIHGNTSASMASPFETIRGEIDGIIAKMKPILEAAIGPAIGGARQRALDDIDRQIEVHEQRVAIAERTTDRHALYDALVETGWKIKMDRDAWAADEMLSGGVASDERYFIGRLRFQRQKIDALFERFVRKDGRLGKAEEPTA